MNPRLDLVRAPAPDAVALATDELAAGRMVLLRDDCERRGEGDLLIAAEFAAAEAINFMVTEARGLACVALSTERCAQLGLEQIGNRGDQSSLGDSAMVSIEARDGVTTGISAADSARTIAMTVAVCLNGTDFTDGVPGERAAMALDGLFAAADPRAAASTAR